MTQRVFSVSVPVSGWSFLRSLLGEAVNSASTYGQTVVVPTGYGHGADWHDLTFQSLVAVRPESHDLSLQGDTMSPTSLSVPSVCSEEPLGHPQQTLLFNQFPFGRTSWKVCEDKEKRRSFSGFPLMSSPPEMLLYSETSLMG